MSNLQNEINSLSPAEKFDFLDALRESLEAEGSVLTGKQQSELDDRVAKYEQNPEDVLSWEQVRAGLFKKQ